MGWTFKKWFQAGPVRTSVTQNGMGASVGILGFRIGVSPGGKRFVSFRIPGTGIYYMKYFGTEKKSSNAQKPVSSSLESRTNQREND
ncbi:MAG: hypothetical protein KatS3mg031_1189 [Chitinophagales bacterium]|nr:MAG: hypothetical protein KatS3mg031_1189 [Chitinophagales bacterium]